ncbi:stage III sporulation protein SpoIIIAB [Paenibacillus aurantius]|uniref:Stage III sporulation protein SpoIIIAB n=1 Tax=Paenibacillus aurantius TaxID=2918900 RepID=A0AA96RDR9_9BACL|nr:stage III sporulation protein SpoIIIAB [Paenibacillus aurantius]WNQ09403.1 stage III sporulation protein SpoIIIAB [Paenibacillus aurantius]
MLKLIGALFVLFAGTMLGFYQAGQLARRPRQIRQLILALQRLETEILYGFSPLPEALQTVSRPLASPLSELFRQASDSMEERSGASAEESWNGAVSRTWGQTSMKGNEQEVMKQLGHTLGISDREDQIKHIRLAVSHLQAEEQTAAEEQKRFEKMWKSLGVLAAALIVLLMY